MNRPTCTVAGVPARGGVCSRVIVGGQECGAPSGSCHYQGPALRRPQAATDAALAVRLRVALTRRCIACGAQVAPGQSEACPHA